MVDTEDESDDGRSIQQAKPVIVFAAPVKNSFQALSSINNEPLHTRCNALTRELDKDEQQLVDAFEGFAKVVSKKKQRLTKT